VDVFRSAIADLLHFDNYILGTFGIIYGYSYFLFKAINYLISSYQRQISNYSLTNYFNFMFFFSAFTAGPIGRYIHYQDKDFSVPAESADAFIEGLHRILNGLIKKYDIADDMTVVIARDKLFRLVDGKIAEGVNAEMRKQLQCIRACHGEFRHMIGLVEEDTRFLPGLLFITPVAKFRGYPGVDVGPRL